MPNRPTIVVHPGWGFENSISRFYSFGQLVLFYKLDPRTARIINASNTRNALEDHPNAQHLFPPV